MIKILRNKDFNITDFLVDNVEDVNELKNTNGCAAGSTAYIITTGETYIKKTNGDWIEKVESNEENINSNDSEMTKLAYSGSFATTPEAFEKINVEIPTSGLYLITFSYIIQSIEGEEHIHLELGSDFFVASGTYKDIGTLSDSGCCVMRLEEGTQNIAIIITLGARTVDWNATITKLGD